MAVAGGNSDIFTNKSSIEGEDIESGSITEQFNKNNLEDSPIDTSLAEMEDLGNIDGHVEDIDKWVVSLEKILEDLPSYMCSVGHPGRISRIPENLREVDKKGYEPYVLSIGPYHHTKPRVQEMEMRKKLVLKCLLENKPELTLKDYLKEIASIEPIARSFYSDIEMESEHFAHMLLLDSVFLLTMFCGMTKSHERMYEVKTITDTDERETNKTGNNETVDDNENRRLMTTTNDLSNEEKSGENWYWNSFVHDLFLLENQLPFFVLHCWLHFSSSFSRLCKPTILFILIITLVLMATYDLSWYLAPYFSTFCSSYVNC